MNAKASEENDQKPRSSTGKCYWRAAIAGAVIALSGGFGFCVYHAHTRTHEGICKCAKYGAMITVAFSHPIAIVGALAGICILSIAYLVRHIYRCVFHRRGN